MRKNPDYFLKNIFNTYYLIPCGQAIENRSHAVRINDAAAFIWNKLEVIDDIDRLTQALAKEYNVSSSEYEMLSIDISNLLNNLTNEGSILPDSLQNQLKTPYRYRFMQSIDNLPHEPLIELINIAGIKICFWGKKKYFSKHFERFIVHDEPVDAKSISAIPVHDVSATSYDPDIHNSSPTINITVTEQEPPEPETLCPAIRGDTVTIYDAGSIYILRSVELPRLREAHISKDGSNTILFINTDQDSRHNQMRLFPSEIDNTPDECVFQTVRFAFLLAAQARGMYVIHSASILHDGKAWLFSAPSGTGKSTHTKIWHRLYGTPYLNGDLNLLAFEDGRPVVKGIPWCGTSGLFTEKTYPLGGIVLLSRNEKNYMEELSPDEQALGISMRFISPKWTPEQASLSIDFAMRISESARIARLHCNMEDEAAKVCRSWIERR